MIKELTSSGPSAKTDDAEELVVERLEFVRQDLVKVHNRQKADIVVDVVSPELLVVITAPEEE